MSIGGQSFFLSTISAARVCQLWAHLRSLRRPQPSAGLQLSVLLLGALARILSGQTESMEGAWNEVESDECPPQQPTALKIHSSGSRHILGIIKSLSFSPSHLPERRARIVGDGFIGLPASSAPGDIATKSGVHSLDVRPVHLPITNIGSFDVHNRQRAT